MCVLLVVCSSKFATFLGPERWSARGLLPHERIYAAAREILYNYYTRSRGR